MGKKSADEELCSYLDTPAFRGSPLRSAWTLLQTAIIEVAWWTLAASVAPSAGHAVMAALLVFHGFMMLRITIIFHDCGHGSFFQGFKHAKHVNWLAHHLSAAGCGTPTDWSIGHTLHHANVGNLGQSDYDWGETIYHTAASYLSKPLWQRRAWKVLRHPVPFFALGPALTWWVKFRLPFELRPGRKAAYRFSDKLLNTVCYGARLKLAHSLGIFGLVAAADYLGMLMGVLLFHWQHVYRSGYARPATSWKLREAAIVGSSIAYIPEPLKYFTLGIEYHHIHHFRTKIPGYMLRQVHEAAPAGMWHEVVTLDLPRMWDSLWLQCYDEELGEYATFAEVERRQAGAASRAKAK